eukprot:2726168-Rhodomonas_salina.2
MEKHIRDRQQKLCSDEALAPLQTGHGLWGQDLDLEGPGQAIVAKFVLQVLSDREALVLEGNGKVDLVFAGGAEERRVEGLLGEEKRAPLPLLVGLEEVEPVDAPQMRSLLVLGELGLPAIVVGDADPAGQVLEVQDVLVRVEGRLALVQTLDQLPDRVSHLDHHLELPRFVRCHLPRPAALQIVVPGPRSPMSAPTAKKSSPQKDRIAGLLPVGRRCDFHEGTLSDSLCLSRHEEVVPLLVVARAKEDVHLERVRHLLLHIPLVLLHVRRRHNLLDVCHWDHPRLPEWNLATPATGQPNAA